MSTSESPVAAPTLRERKRAQTRERIISAGIELFGSNGYDATTVADIAAAADIGTRTFFGYFESKDALLFGAGSDRTDIAVATIAAASPDEDPARVLLRGLDAASEATERDFLSDQAQLRLQLVDSVPAVRARGALEQIAAIRAIADALGSRFATLDAAHAAALAGAFVGASSAAVQTVLQEDRNASPVRRARRIRTAAAFALGVQE
ncbi:TetR family transcriptional regulator [Planctomonas sp. JC2975]|uniref:TetR family transcriptional regulator n=1 Tax=Planctomonas sp. JC2975 TaxID=2729626 RepID=UPI001472CC93|nr:TetR family transcriptional regulator [Planctomonas sp. JC2975]